MAVSINIPKLGMTMAEATLVEWKAKEGDWIERGAIILTIETEKVSFDIEAPSSGFLYIIAAVGSVIPVGDCAGYLFETKEEFEQFGREHVGAKEREVKNTVATVIPPEKSKGEIGERVKVSPAARKFAETNQVDLNGIAGSGPGGRILMEDVEKALAAKENFTLSSGTSQEGKRVKMIIPLKGVRKIIAENTTMSLAMSAQMTTSGELDMQELAKFRTALLEREESLGVRVSYSELFVFILAKALKENPEINSSIVGEEIKVWENINVAVAVALSSEDFGGGLIAPVVKGADKKSLIEISRSVKELVKKARNRELMPDDLSDATFTLTNIGGFGLGWTFSTPIITQPQAAIFRTSGIEDRPVVREGQIVIRPIMVYSLTYDHRLLDAASAQKFLFRVKELVENPFLLAV